MWDEWMYLKRVERTLNRLRSVCLGQDIISTEALPNHLRELPSEQQAERIADQILFSLLRVSDEITPEERSRCQEWLYGTVLFLMIRCNQNEWTFREMKHLLEVSKGVRELLFEDLTGPEFQAMKEDKTPPKALRKELDHAVLVLLKSCGKDQRATEVCRKLDIILDEFNSP